ncbi:MAG: hypothetical protein PUH70_07015 [Clostridiales bacterium]|nr:hypothetical protein [Clostridiales bacterium]MDY5515806.1 hypothetical protein [Candidatus Ventricola sp.]
MTRALSFRLTADALPDSLLPGQDARRFSLPGAQELSRFADLLGETPEDAQEAPEAQEASVPFDVPGLLPREVSGPAQLHADLRFDRLHGERAWLEFRLLAGRGEALLGDTQLARFDGGPLVLDVTDALRLGRRQTLTLRFDETRPAGLPGAALLRVTQLARIEFAGAEPNADAATMTLRARVAADSAGRYRLSVRPCPPDGAQAVAAPCAARELPFSLEAGARRDIALTLSVPGDRFVCGKPYAAPSLRLELTCETDVPAPVQKERRPRGRRAPDAVPLPLRRRTRCDSATLLCGYPGKAPRAFVPLPRELAELPPQLLLPRLEALHLRAVSLPFAPPDALCAACTQAGIALLLRRPRGMDEAARLSRFPCVCFCDAAAPDAPAPEENAWQLGSMVGLDRQPEPGITPAELLAEAAGRPLDAKEAGAAAVLQWLRAVRIRLLAEAARQGRFSGPLCAPQELLEPDIAQALTDALAPLHLSALPLRGAWWTGTHFSASLFACLEGALPDAPLEAHALLETESGETLARFDAPCAAPGGALGTLEARLPDAPCVLTLTTRLLCGDTVLEQSALPVYVGERGVLEAAFGGAFQE